jgi:hypothetical protein
VHFFCILKGGAGPPAVLGMLYKCNISSQNNKKKTNLKIANIGKDDLAHLKNSKFMTVFSEISLGIPMSKAISILPI